MKRFAEEYLVEWKQRKNRKPLILRGARQTGKTYLVEKFAGEHFNRFLKIDFEFDTDIKSIFENRDPGVITGELSLYSDYDIIPGKTLLFFDEIQACPEAILSLRYFFEKMPELHVIAAGSLLDFTLQDFQYAMPVGRIEFLHLFPLSFSEFLLAKNSKLSEFVSNWDFREKINESVHTKLMELLRHFFFTGGMPEASASWIEHENLMEIQRIQSAILTTMQNDFAKYGSRSQQEILQKVMFFVPRNMGKKVKYVNVDRDVRSYALKEAFFRLQMSRIISLVHKTDANGVPLEAEKNERIFKAVFLDIGLVNRACGLKLINTDELITIYEGGLAEQFAGQELLSSGPGFEEPALYYWLREEKNANAEIDYLITHGTKVIPLEIKAGKTGTLKSMHVFLHGKKSDFGIRLNMDRPSTGNFRARVRLKNTHDELDYTLMSLPLYLAGQVPRIMDDFC
ncbi:MAG: ATP-binding protein [Desulfotignum sp.]|nr:AAA family ATPase [Desulfobacteraceae bacterium]